MSVIDYNDGVILNDTTKYNIEYDKNAVLNWVCCQIILNHNLVEILPVEQQHKMESILFNLGKAYRG